LLASIWDKAKDAVGVIPAGFIIVRRAANEIEDRLRPRAEGAICEVFVLVAAEIAIVLGSSEGNEGEEENGGETGGEHLDELRFFV
jgi:hypothetical protein